MKASNLLLSLFSGGLLAGSATAALLVHEPFDYPDAPLNGRGGALGTTGTWASNDTSVPTGWHVHPEGSTTGIGIDAAVPPALNEFDGAVANLATSGGFAGMVGPEDRGLPFGADSGTGNMNGAIGLASSVTSSFQSNTTTWISYVSVKAWDRNEEQPNLVLGTDPAPNGSRGDNFGGIGTGFSGFGTGGGPTRNNRTDIYPMFYNVGQYSNVNGAVPNNAYNQAAFEVLPADGLVWQANDTNGDFGAPNIVVMKLEWDAGTGGEDIISIASFLEGGILSEANFDDMVAGTPNLSSANWDPANRPNLDQSQLDTITFMGIKYFVDEIRLGTTFDDVTPIPEPSSLILLGLGLIGLAGRRRRK